MRHRNSQSSSTFSSDESTATSLSSDSSVDVKQPRRRRANRRKKRCNKNKGPCHQQAELSLDEQARYLALDCEMVGVGHHGNTSSVARVTVVNWAGDIVFDEFICQEREVIDYRTFVSGITAEDLETASMTIQQCRDVMLELLEGKVLIGHALKNDMKALGITHPWFLTRDTAKYEPFQQVRFDDGVLWPRKLKDLVKEKLQRDIQVGGQPHSAYEDAVAALDLYRMSRQKWEKAMDYKIAKTQEIENKKSQRATQ